ncbi:hypothetical protein LTR81_028072 [Elasticomyces elasticus]
MIENWPLRIYFWELGDAGPECLSYSCPAGDLSIHGARNSPAQLQETTPILHALAWQVPIPNAQVRPTLAYHGTPRFSAWPHARVQALVATQPAARQQLAPYPGYSIVAQQYQQAETGEQAVTKTTYAYTPKGLPVNTTRGTVSTESCGVFVSGLNYKARCADVEVLFSEAGAISKCEVQKETSTGRSKGKATIRFASATDAQQAIDMFHGKHFMKMVLKVRLDTEKTAISSPSSTQSSRSSQPIIVNGSQAQ